MKILIHWVKNFKKSKKTRDQLSNLPIRNSSIENWNPIKKERWIAHYCINIFHSMSVLINKLFSVQWIISLCEAPDSSSKLN